MNIPIELVQFIGSLVAIFAVAALVRWMKLGTGPQIRSEQDARNAANEAVDGFCATQTAIDRNGKGAILRDDTGRILLLKPHGNKFAGRILTPSAHARLAQGPSGAELEVDCGERRFGKVTLKLDEPQIWVEAINALEGSGNA